MFEQLDVIYAEQVGLVLSAPLSARHYACLCRRRRLNLDYNHPAANDRQGNQTGTAPNSGVPRYRAMTNVTPMVFDRLQRLGGDEL